VAPTLGNNPSPAVTRILDATLTAAALHGIKRLSVSDIADQAQMSRPTIYKHVGNKDAIVMATVVREAQRLVAEIMDEMGRSPEPRTGIRDGVAAALRLTREHPLLDRILTTEPDSLVPLLTADGGPVSQLIRTEIDGRTLELFPGLSPLAARRAGDLLTRLFVSYAISAPDDPPEVVAESIATIIFAGVAALQAELAQHDSATPSLSARA